MDETLRHQRDTSLGQLETLIRRGRELRNTRAVDATRAWQQECAAAINQLSGGSKAHWLARAYSGAFLVRSGQGDIVVEADATEIADRILDVLAQGATSLSRMDDVAAASSGAAPRPRQFEFVHNAALRPVLERALADSRDAFERGDFGLSLILSCGIIDAVLTDALDQRAESSGQEATGSGQQAAGRGQLVAGNGQQAAGSTQQAAGSGQQAAGSGQQAAGSGQQVADEGQTGADATEPTASCQPPAASFEERIAAAERAGLIRGGCARLPPVARTYRDLTDADGELCSEAPVSEGDARRAGQVLRVVMRDLDPGR